MLGDYQDGVVAGQELRALAVAAHLAGQNAFTYGRSARPRAGRRRAGARAVRRRLARRAAQPDQVASRLSSAAAVGASACEQPLDECRLRRHDLRHRLLGPEPRDPVELGEGLQPPRAGRPLHFEGVARRRSRDRGRPRLPRRARTSRWPAGPRRGRRSARPARAARPPPRTHAARRRRRPPRRCSRPSGWTTRRRPPLPHRAAHVPEEDLRYSHAAARSSGENRYSRTPALCRLCRGRPVTARRRRTGPRLPARRGRPRSRSTTRCRGHAR